MTDVLEEIKLELGKDDWELTSKELRGQRVQLMLQLAVVEAGIERCTLEIRKYGKK